MGIDMREIENVLRNENEYDVERILCYDSIIYKVLCKEDEENLVDILKMNIK